MDGRPCFGILIGQNFKKNEIIAFFSISGISFVQIYRLYFFRGCSRQPLMGGSFFRNHIDCFALRPDSRKVPLGDIRHEFPFRLSKYNLPSYILYFLHQVCIRNLAFCRTFVENAMERFFIASESR